MSIPAQPPNPATPVPYPAHHLQGMAQRHKGSSRPRTPWSRQPASVGKVRLLMCPDGRILRGVSPRASSAILQVEQNSHQPSVVPFWSL